MIIQLTQAWNGLPVGTTFNTNAQVALDLVKKQLATLINPDDGAASALAPLPSGTPSKLSATLTRPADTISYAAGDHVYGGSVLTLANAALSNGGGGFIMDCKVETDAVQFAGTTLRCWLFNDTPSNVVADNAAYVNSFVNADKRCACAYFDILFDPLLVGSDCVIGKAQPNAEYITKIDGKNIYMLVQVLGAVTTPKSAGIIKFYMNVVKTA